MSRVVWIDAGQGAAGDMLLAALLDLGADEAAVRAGLARLPVEPVSLHVSEVRRFGLRARHVRVTVPDRAAERTLREVLAVVDAAGLAPEVRCFAAAVFTRLAEAEAAVHGLPVGAVHLHEVGALDAIADVVGCGLALHSLGLLAADPPVRFVVSPVAVGSGAVRTAHGVLPVPAPAVLRLLVGAPIAGHHAAQELCTPTGAALLAELAGAWGPLPGCVPVRVGVGAGARDPAGHPNVLRVVLGDEVAGVGAAPRPEPLVVVEATVDDLDPRLWPDVLDALRAAGAADAWCVPVVGRKGRPGHVLTALAAPDRVEAISLAVFAHTSTLGLRRYPVERLALDRDEVTVSYRGHPVAVKRGLLGGRVRSVQPEYDDVRRAAAATGEPVRRVLEEARRLAGETGPADTADTAGTAGTAERAGAAGATK